MKRPRTVAHPQRPLDQGHPAGRCSRRPRSSRSASSRCSVRSRTPTRRSTAPSYSKRAAAVLPARRSPPRARAPGRLARMGIAVAAGPVRQARAHDPSPPRRHPRRQPPRPLQRAPGRPQQPHPPHQPPQLRLSLRHPSSPLSTSAAPASSFGQAVAEERLQGRGDRGHDATSRATSSRPAACANSSGAAER
jgi:hypothetical protein